MQKSAVPEVEDITHYRFFRRLCSLSGIRAIYLFGSRARGGADEWADVDLAIDAPEMTPQQWQEVQHIAENADILVPVQPVWLQQVSEGVFRNEIERDKLLLYRSKE